MTGVTPVVTPAILPKTAGRGWWGWGHNERSQSSCTCQPYCFLFMPWFYYIYVHKYWWKLDFNFCILRFTIWTTLCPNQWVWILPVGLDFASRSGFYQWVWILPVGLDFTSGSGFCQWVWILPVGLDCQWVWIWQPHWPDSLLYHVIYTQPWHKYPVHTLKDQNYVPIKRDFIFNQS